MTSGETNKFSVFQVIWSLKDPGLFFELLCLRAALIDGPKVNLQKVMHSHLQ